MLRADYRGARGANAGDDFHELWALRYALALLDETSGLTALTLEGLSREDESGKPPETWDGVDCGLYYGAGAAGACERVEIEQLKYSGSDPTKRWTVSDLTRNTRRNGNNSVVRRLADAFQGVAAKRSGIADGVTVRLVSNRPVDPMVVRVFHNLGTGAEGSGGSRGLADDALVVAASGLKGDLLQAFARSLDFSRTGSRFEIEDAVLRTIADWSDDDARTILDTLLRFVGTTMLPERKGARITDADVLVQFGVSNRAALFPCRSEIQHVDDPVPRTASSDIVSRMVAGERFLCLHGPAGCGKTTALQEIGAQLPDGSVMMVFDCYGAGRYLDSDAYRHRSRDAFLQLSNELAAGLRIPLLLKRSADTDYPRSFVYRANRGAQVVATRGKDALLVVAVDAADNSLTAADNLPGERSFVRDFITLGGLADNVRLIVTARTGRLDQLVAARRFIPIEMRGFELQETKARVSRIWPDLPAGWADDFHYFSQGNPRVQSYALQYGVSDFVRTLDYLRPQGKGLHQIFQQLLGDAERKAGGARTVDDFCAALIALPRPIPLQALEAITGTSAPCLRDMCADLAPGVIVSDERIGFADEDFEYFVRTRAAEGLAAAQGRAADWFMKWRDKDAYAAAHVAAVLYHARRGREVVDLVEEPEPVAIQDPLLRREVQLQRLRTGIRVSTEQEDTASAVRSILAGAEAMRTEEAIHQLVVENPDLATAFMRESAARLVLMDAREIEHHGPLLFHLLLEDARAGNNALAREDWRYLQAWLRRRDDDRAQRQAQHPGHAQEPWKIEARDIAAEVEGAVLAGGPRAAIRAMRGWRPRRIGLYVAQILVPRLIQGGKDPVIEQCLEERLVPDPWDLLLYVPLALSGRAVDLARLESALAKIARHRLIHLAPLHNYLTDDTLAYWPDIVLTACELMIARTGNWEPVLPILAILNQQELRRTDRLSQFQGFLLDLLLRAHALMANKEGRAMTIDSFLIDVPPVETQREQETPRLWRESREHRDELSDLIGPIIPLYEVRAKLLTGIVDRKGAEQQLARATAAFGEQDYRFARRHGSLELRRRAGAAVAKLLCVPGIAASAVADAAFAVFGDRVYPLDEIEVLSILTLQSSLRERASKIIVARAATVKALRTVAQEKIDIILRLARLLLPISRADASVLFDQAHEMAGEINVDAVHQLNALAAIAASGASGLDITERRTAGSEFVSVATDAAVRLSGQDAFPWESVSHALAVLDLPLALAAVARWEDSGVVNRGACLPTILQTSLRDRLLTAGEATALLPLLDFADVSLFASIVRELDTARLAAKRTILEELARDELLRFGLGERVDAVRMLSGAATGGENKGLWLQHLQSAHQFHAAAAQNVSQVPESVPKVGTEDQKRPLRVPADRRYVAPAEITDAVKRVTEEAKRANVHVAVSDVLEQIRAFVALPDRAAHLNALSDIPCDKIADPEIATAIMAAVEEWNSPAVEDWYQRRLAHLLVERLPGFVRYLPYDTSAPIVTALEKLSQSGKDIARVLIEGIAKHVDRLSAATVYALVKLIVDRVSPECAGTVLSRYVRRLAGKVPPNELDHLTLADIPTSSAAALARFLFVLLSDCDVRIRWRAAHAVRRLARFGETEPLRALLDLYDRTVDATFRAPNAPFYFLTARLWLLFAVDRIAAEAPSALRGYGARLFDIATDEALPHVLIRAFAKDAASKLTDEGTLKLTPRQRAVLKRSNMTELPPKRVSDRYEQGLEPTRPEADRKRRFHFNSIDTLPYWYEPAARLFWGVRVDEFTDLAERWIVDTWKADPSTWMWKNESRQKRFPERSWGLWSNDHGSMPTIERYSTYLEWHAMCCTIGELMRSRPTLKTKRDDLDRLSDWLDGYRLTCPPHWLADLRAPKPLRARFWSAPSTALEAWLQQAGDEDFLREIEIGGSRSGMLVADCWYETRSSAFSSEVRVSSALVEPSTAAALVRALQTVQEPSNYAIPSEGSDHEIDHPPYRLVGWLGRAGADSRIDGKDPFRNRVSGGRSRPSASERKRLKQVLAADGTTMWVDRNGTTSYIFEEWSDEKDEERPSYGVIQSGGQRLWVSIESLQRLLLRARLELLVRVALTKRKGSSEYRRHSQEEAPWLRYEKILLLRRDGTIEAAQGRLGTWFSSS